MHGALMLQQVSHTQLADIEACTRLLDALEGLADRTQRDRGTLVHKELWGVRQQRLRLVPEASGA
eukprot:2217220-Prymnesium_polylepis.2